jgi:Protein of unknown function (DUF3379)
MNCEEYREAIATDPSFDGGAGHLNECAACQQYRSDMQALDQRISRALAIDVPELQVPELPELSTSKSELSTSKSDKVVALHRRQLAPQTWFAMAATVVVAALLGVRLVGTGIEYDSLADEILAHLDGEPNALRVTDVAITAKRLNAVVPADIALMDHSAGLITYAQTCPIGGRDVPHLVIQGERGPVTILLMPEEKISGPQRLSGDNVNGIILPVGNGSIAIIGERDERLDRIEESVLKSVAWST